LSGHRSPVRSPGGVIVWVVASVPAWWCARH
jgi:hypothetical protein